MNESQKVVLVNKLESIVETHKQELKSAIDESADNAVDLLKGLAILSSILLIVYLIYQAKSGKEASNKLSSRLNARMAPLITKALQKGTTMFMVEAMDKLVDYLSSRQHKEETDKGHVSSE